MRGPSHVGQSGISAALEDAYIPGLVHVDPDRYPRRDIESVNALDVYERKTAHERIEASIKEDDETPTGQVVPAGAGAAATAVPVPEEAARAVA